MAKLKLYLEQIIYSLSVDSEARQNICRYVHQFHLYPTAKVSPRQLILGPINKHVRK